MNTYNVVSGLFVVIITLAWILGIIRTFLEVDDKFSVSKSRSVSLFLAWLLSFIASIVVTFSIPLGIMEIFLQCSLYKTRKRMTQEQIEIEDNISLWTESRKDDRIKLIYAYVISLIVSSSFIMGNTLGGIIADLYSKYGYRAIQDILSSNLSWQIYFATFKLGLSIYLFIVILPTLIRFMIIRHRMKYGIEITFYLYLSLLVSMLSQYILLDYMPTTFGLLNTLTVYCILSYKSSEYSEEWNSYTFNPIVFTLVALALMTLMSGIMTEQRQWYMPIWEAIFACCVLTRHKEKTAHEEPSQTTEPPHHEPHQEPEQPQPPRAETPDIADTLIDIGLAHIGRTTALDNPYITPEQTQARHNAERPFLKLLSERYTDAQTRKALSHHFMLYKEVTLFMIFASVLRNDKPLHTKVQRKLKIRLSLGLPSKVIVKCNDYRRKLSEKFYESYTRTKDLAGTLDYVFWSVLPEKIKGEGFADLTGNGHLKDIFNYTREAVVQEYKNITS